MRKGLDVRDCLTQHMEARREELGERWTVIAERGGTSKETLRAVRKKETRVIRVETRRAIDDGLFWQRGSVAEILRGGQPTPIEPAGSIVSDLPAGDSLRQQLSALVRRMPDAILPEWYGKIFAAVAEYEREAAAQRDLGPRGDESVLQR